MRRGTPDSNDDLRKAGPTRRTSGVQRSADALVSDVLAGQSAIPDGLGLSTDSVISSVTEGMM
jgi:hypothetical protein